MNTDAISVDEALLILKIAFLVLLYLFIWRIVRTAGRDIVSPQESFVLAPSGGVANALPRPGAGRLVVVESPGLERGATMPLDSRALTIGRSSKSDIHLRGDRFASALHARVEPRGESVWIADAGSTNGTFVNGARIDGSRQLAPGDVVRVGETDLRFER